MVRFRLEELKDLLFKVAELLYYLQTKKISIVPDASIGFSSALSTNSSVPSPLRDRQFHASPVASPTVAALSIEKVASFAFLTFMLLSLPGKSYCLTSVTSGISPPVAAFSIKKVASFEFSTFMLLSLPGKSYCLQEFIITRTSGPPSKSIGSKMKTDKKDLSRQQQGAGSLLKHQGYVPAAEKVMMTL
jgi:hypothetical protein